MGFTGVSQEIHRIFIRMTQFEVQKGFTGGSQGVHRIFTRRFAGDSPKET